MKIFINKNRIKRKYIKKDSDNKYYDHARTLIFSIIPLVLLSTSVITTIAISYQPLRNIQSQNSLPSITSSVIEVLIVNYFNLYIKIRHISLNQNLIIVSLQYIIYWPIHFKQLLNAHIFIFLSGASKIFLMFKYMNVTEIYRYLIQIYSVNLMTNIAKSGYAIKQIFNNINEMYVSILNLTPFLDASVFYIYNEVSFATEELIQFLTLLQQFLITETINYFLKNIYSLYYIINYSQKIQIDLVNQINIYFTHISTFLLYVMLYIIETLRFILVNIYINSILFLNTTSTFFYKGGYYLLGVLKGMIFIVLNWIETITYKILYVIDYPFYQLNKVYIFIKPYLDIILNILERSIFNIYLIFTTSLPLLYHYFQVPA